MPEYHVHCGNYDNKIYAGVTTKDRFTGEIRFKSRNEVTDEAVKAIVKHFKKELDLREKHLFSTQFEFEDGTVIQLTIEKVNKCD